MNKRETLLLVGTGAVTNAWNPVLEVFKRRGLGSELTSELVNCYLSTLVSEARLFQYLANNTLFRNKRRTASKDKSANIIQRLKEKGQKEEFARKRDEIVRTLQLIRNEIARAIGTATLDGTLTARPELGLVIEKLINPYSDKFWVVNANWDEVVDRYIDNNAVAKRLWQPPILHIHGNAKFNCISEGSLLLPSEMGLESYYTPEQNRDRWVNIGSARIATFAVSRLVIYGLSLSPLDPGLASIVAAALSGSSCQHVSIIDLEPKLIASRARLLMPPGRDIPIVEIHPDQLPGYSP